MKPVFYWKHDYTKVNEEVLHRLLIEPFPPFTIYEVGKDDGMLHQVENMYLVDEDDGSDY